MADGGKNSLKNKQTIIGHGRSPYSFLAIGGDTLGEALLPTNETIVCDPAPVFRRYTGFFTYSQTFQKSDTDGHTVTKTYRRVMDNNDPTDEDCKTG